MACVGCDLTGAFDEGVTTTVVDVVDAVDDTEEDGGAELVVVDVVDEATVLAGVDEATVLDGGGGGGGGATYGTKVIGCTSVSDHTDCSQHSLTQAQ